MRSLRDACFHCAIDFAFLGSERAELLGMQRLFLQVGKRLNERPFIDTCRAKKFGQALKRDVKWDERKISRGQR